MLADTKSIGGMVLMARPRENREPRTHCIADLSILYDKKHLSQFMTWWYGWSHFSARREANLL